MLPGSPLARDEGNRPAQWFVRQQLVATGLTVSEPKGPNVAIVAIHKFMPAVNPNFHLNHGVSTDGHFKKPFKPWQQIPKVNLYCMKK